MSEKRSLAFQRSCVEHLIALHSDADDSVIDGAKQAALSLAWFERHGELTKELVRLEKEAPHLAALLKEEPDARIVDVRTRRTDFDGYANGADDGE